VTLFDGQDHCFLNMGSDLVGYDILRSYMHSFLHGRYDLTVCMCYTMQLNFQRLLSGKFTKNECEGSNFVRF